MYARARSQARTQIPQRQRTHANPPQILHCMSVIQYMLRNVTPAVPDVTLDLFSWTQRSSKQGRQSTNAVVDLFANFKKDVMHETNQI